MHSSRAATRIFLEKYGQLIRCPGLNPDYIIADANRSANLEPLFFIYEDEHSAYFHPFHKIPIAQTEYYQIQSAYGYSGPVATTKDPTFLKNAVRVYKDWCQENNIIVETIRFHPLIGNATNYDGETFVRRKTVYVDLNKNDLLSSYATRTRTAIRKAIKSGVEIAIASEEKFYQVFPNLYLTRMQEIKAQNYYYFNDSYFKSICALQNAYNLIASYKGEVIAGAIFLLGGNMLEYHLSAANNVGKQLCAMNLLLHHAFSYGQRQNLSYAHLGGGVSLAEDDKLLFYKLGFGGHLIDFEMGKCIHDLEIYSKVRGFLA